MLEILGKSPSINVRKVLWTCFELDLPFRHEQWGAGFQTTDTPAFRALNPNATVPVIRDGDFVLWESNAICRYLAHKHGRADLLPAAPEARALVEQWMDWQATDFNNAWRYAFMGLVRQSPAYADQTLIAASVASWNRQIALLDGQLDKTGAYATGPDFTLADIVLGLSVNRWLLAPIERPDYAAVSAYYERLKQKPGFTLHGVGGGV